jgi:hypothetical protein
MGRSYAVKGRKKKRKLHEAAASDAGPLAVEAEELPLPEEAGGEDKGKDEEAAAAGEDEEEHAAVEGLPVVPRPVDAKRRPGAIFVLERACLEVGKVGKVQWVRLQQEIALFYSAVPHFHSEFVLSLLGDYALIGFRLVLELRDVVE